MRVIIAGSRNITDATIVEKAIAESGFTISQVVSGVCRGVDELGEKWALDRNISVKAFPANWQKYGKQAGPLRNEEMAQNAEALIAVWDGVSSGTRTMIDIAKRVGLKVYVYRTGGG